MIEAHIREKARHFRLSFFSGMLYTIDSSVCFLRLYFLLEGMWFDLILQVCKQKAVLAAGFFLFLLFSCFINVSAASGDAAEVTGVIVNSISDGMAPFDSDNSPGNDASNDNRILRTFDTAVYSLEFVTNMKPGGGRSLSEAVVNIRMSIAGSKGDYRWDTDSMGWLQPGYSVSYDNGRITLNAKVKLSQVDGVDPVPGTSAVNIYLMASGVSNGSKVEPEFSVWMDGETESKARSFRCDSSHTTADGKSCSLTVSADAGRFGVAPCRPTQQRWGYLNPSTGKLTLDSGKSGYSPSMILSTGCQFYLRGEEGKGIKGCEVPKGDITFILDPKYMDESGEYKRLELWDSLNLHRRNTSTEDGIACVPGTTYGRETHWATSYGNGQSDVTYTPRFPEEGGVQSQTFSDPGEFKMERLSDGRWKVTIYDYSIDGRFPKYHRFRIPVGVPDYDEKVNLFTAFGAQWYCPTTGKNGETRNMVIDITDLSVKGVSGRPLTSHDGQDHWSMTGAVSTSCSADRNSYALQRYRSDGYQGADRFEASTIFDGLVQQQGGVLDQIRIPFGSNIQDVDHHTYAADILLKFDDRTLEPYTGRSLRINKNGGYPNGAKDFRLQGRQYEGTQTLLYAVKKDGTGWTGLAECRTAKIADLKYYADREEAERQGTIVGILYELRDMDWYMRCWWDNYVELHVKDDAEIGRVGFVTHSTRTWSGPRSEMDEEVQPGSNADGKSSGWTSEVLMSNYEPRTFSSAEDGYWYDRDSGVQGTGCCVLVVGEMPKSQIVSEVAGKTWWNLNAGERIMDLRLDSSVTTISGNGRKTDLTIEYVLDRHQHYVKGSGTRGGTYVPADGAAPSKVIDGTPIEPSVSKNENGQEVLTWRLSGVTAGEAVDSIHLQLEIGTELDPKTDVNELDNPLTQTVQCRSTYGPETGKTSFDNRVIKSPAVSMQLRPFGASTIEQNEDAVWRVVLSNNGGSDSRPFSQYLVLPYEGDGRDSKFAGTPELVSMVLDASAGKRSLASGLHVYVTTDPKVRDGKFDAQDLNGLSVSWTEVSGTGSGNSRTYSFSRKDVTAVKFSGGMLGAHEGLNYLFTMRPGDGCQGGDLYSLSASVYGERFPGTVFAAPCPIQVVKRTLSGDVFNDRDKSGLYNEDTDLFVSGVKLRVLDGSGNPAKDVFGRAIPDCVTKADGKWSFTNLGPGVFSVVTVDLDGKYESVKNGPDYSGDTAGAKKDLTGIDSDCKGSAGKVSSDGRVIWSEDGETKSYLRQEYSFLPAAEMNPAVQEYENIRFGLGVYWSDLTVEQVVDKTHGIQALGGTQFLFKAQGTAWDGTSHTYYFCVDATDQGGGSGGGEAPHDLVFTLEVDDDRIPGFTEVLEGRQTLRIPSGHYWVTPLDKEDWSFLDFLAVNGTVDGERASMDLLLHESGLVHARDYRTAFDDYHDSLAGWYPVGK